ncbi:MAG: response regulator [Deltaproteobacteria bacterium]|nr:response regulator [Myxococcales bacterium]MCZ6569836.1 response regulator [Deltaproteobacteria bacterium]MCZ6714554.1 response regulator [Deltaproteobacteria bacterium]MCZ6821730.1 response regulator [Deltaproteobacteria bacterium]TDI95843.1 MAG: response regulator [Deltaproteobacteria bacterium]
MSKRVLITDDAAFMREMLREIISEGGYEVVAEAADGEEALARFHEHHPDVVTLDIVMPGKSGLEVLRELTALEPSACVVMCSALGQEALVMEALEAGAKEYIIKPFKPDQVLGALNEALQKSADRS